MNNEPVQALGLFGGDSPSVFAPVPFTMFLLAWFVLGAFTPLIALLCFKSGVLNSFME